MEVALRSNHIFWTIVRDLPFPQLCRMQRVCKRWRRMLCPKPDNPYWNHVFRGSGDEMTLMVMKQFHGNISPMPYHGLKLAETWLRREQRVTHARINMHKVWLSEFIRTGRVPFRYLSCIARALLSDEQIFACNRCEKRYYGPWILKNPECCCLTHYKKLEWAPHPSLSGNRYHRECLKCGIYQRRGRYCQFCSPPHNQKVSSCC